MVLTSKDRTNFIPHSHKKLFKFACVCLGKMLNHTIQYWHSLTYYDRAILYYLECAEEAVVCLVCNLRHVRCWMSLGRRALDQHWPSAVLVTVISSGST
jgi:hypothetical protein